MPLLSTPRATAAIDRPQVMFVPFLRRQAALQRDAEAGSVESMLDVVGGQGVAGEQHIEIAGADQLDDVLDAARMHHGRTEHREDLVAGLAAAAHGSGDLAHGHALGLFAGDRAGHEFKKILPRAALGWKDA